MATTTHCKLTRTDLFNMQANSQTIKVTLIRSGVHRLDTYYFRNVCNYHEFLRHNPEVQIMDILEIDPELIN